MNGNIWWTLTLDVLKYFYDNEVYKNEGDEP